MGLFSRRNKAADANTANAVGNNRHNRSSIMSNNERRHQSGGVAYGDGALSKRPSVGQWLKVTWPDILTMIIMGAVGLGVSSTQAITPCIQLSSNNKLRSTKLHRHLLDLFRYTSKMVKLFTLNSRIRSGKKWSQSGLPLCSPA